MDNNPYKTPLHSEEWQDGWEKGFDYGVSSTNYYWIFTTIIQTITIIMLIFIRFY